MQIPLEISYRDVKKTDDIDNLIREKVNKMERICDYMTSCRVAVEKPQRTINDGNPYRVRIAMRVPPGHELVVERKPGEGEMSDGLEKVIRYAFDAAKKQLEKLTEKQRENIKQHPQQEVAAIVDRIFYEDGYGFLRTINGREIYFHKNSVVNKDFKEIETGMGVNFFEEQGEEGPQASTVHII
ncbi:MAG TPA: HPF/RaiA family ribosome-associated protein [Ignavibacteriaceae bacterium]|jgi:cold shock CspA family protein/ribosome-associated translation inhibitor RaiA|nr:HPF/RaiA family ribosome-associated protein [Ignavibacteriaceae bacterium]